MQLLLVSCILLELLLAPCRAAPCTDVLCPPGTHHSDQCYEGVTNCVPCPPYTHSETYTPHSERCRIITSCLREHMVVLLEGDSAHDRICGCEADFRFSVFTQSCIKEPAGPGGPGPRDAGLDSCFRCSKDLHTILLSIIGFLVLVVIALIGSWAAFCYRHKHCCWTERSEEDQKNIQFTEVKSSASEIGFTAANADGDIQMTSDSKGNDD